MFRWKGMCIPRLLWERFDAMMEKEVLQRFRNLGIPEFTPDSGLTGSIKGSSSFGLIGRDLLISHLSFPEHTVIPEHTHDQLVICFVRQGSAVQVINTHEYLIKTGEVTIIFPGQKHSLITQDETLDITEIIITDYLTTCL